eukprot:TRINITY_DN3758_c0_g1_i6.p1 TRINITY_DN3758_c0_g1~~TRINITY_DN3758_c0_g1_i6.p1  ORF type:complete len:196 (+),score=-20.32 TRINITY_DN3758_c0_g1_i6:110-697(+)
MIIIISQEHRSLFPKTSKIQHSTKTTNSRSHNCYKTYYILSQFTQVKHLNKLHNSITPQALVMLFVMRNSSYIPQQWTYKGQVYCRQIIYALKANKQVVPLSQQRSEHCTKDKISFQEKMRLNCLFPPALATSYPSTVLFFTVEVTCHIQCHQHNFWQGIRCQFIGATMNAIHRVMHTFNVSTVQATLHISVYTC